MSWCSNRKTLPAMNMIDVIRRRMMMGGKGDPIVVWADHDKIAEYIVKQQYDLGLCASDKYLTQSEAALVETINSDGKVGHISAKDADFSYFQWFVNAEIVSTYSYWVYYALLVVPPNAINLYTPVGIKRFTSSKIVLLSSVPTPLFNYSTSQYPDGPYRANVNRFYELKNSSIYVPDNSYDDWMPYIDVSQYCPSWMSNTGITLHRISELSASELSKIKIPY